MLQQGRSPVPFPRDLSAILILESSLKTARQRRAVFRLQSREFAPEGRELSALKLILRIAGDLSLPKKLGRCWMEV